MVQPRGWKLARESPSGLSFVSLEPLGQLHDQSANLPPIERELTGSINMWIDPDCVSSGRLDQQVGESRCSM